MLVNTIERLAGLPNCRPPLLVCDREYRYLVDKQLQEAGIQHTRMVLEPVGRNTAPAIICAALLAAPEDNLLILPADHLITDTDSFHNAIKLADELACGGSMATFGVVPTAPETGYGYIQRGSALPGRKAFQISRFVEKPDYSVAVQYIDSGDYYWNSGMFLFPATQVLEELERLEPAMISACQRALGHPLPVENVVELGESEFRECPANSIDYALMEKTAKGVVIPLDAGWSDIGSWSALWENSNRDIDGNARSGDTCCEETRNSYIRADKRLITTVGVENLVIVDSDDALLVTTLEQAQNVKNIVDTLKTEKRPEAVQHALVHRPWGTYIGLDSGPGFQVKRITVYPGELLSLQLHHRRSEHWTVVSGTARVTCGDDIVDLSANQSIYIPLETKHRLENIGDELLTLIEVQCGEYLGEDDIVRFEDRYGR